MLFTMGDVITVLIFSHKLFNLHAHTLFAELETKRILLDIFKEKQQKSAVAGTIPSFYKKVLMILVFVLVLFLTEYSYDN